MTGESGLSGPFEFQIAAGVSNGINSGMSLNVLIVPDKFKGTLTAQQAAEAMSRGWRRARPSDVVQLLPMSDGGDGFGEVLSGLLGAALRRTKSVAAARRPIAAAWWHDTTTGTAIVESARVVGLAMLPRGQYHPNELDTFGLGAVLRNAVEQGARRCVIGIGGSATNDGGFGMARALGWQFLNAHEEEITRWTELHHLAVARKPSAPVMFEEVVVAVDVQNPLLGPEGCSRVYGPQKGVTDFEQAERCLGRLAEVLETQHGLVCAKSPGAGAAGGLGFGLMAFLGARMEPGIDIFSRHARLVERVKSSGLVVTGEGAVDAQTLMGKGVGEIALVAQRAGVPCIALAGVVREPEKAKGLFTRAYAMTPGLTDQDSALHAPALWLERLAQKAAQEWL